MTCSCKENKIMNNIVEKEDDDNNIPGPEFEISQEIWNNLNNKVNRCIIPSLCKPLEQYNYQSQSPKDEIILYMPQLYTALEDLLKSLNIFNDRFSNMSMDYNFFLNLYYLVEIMKANEFWENECYSTYSPRIDTWLRNTQDYQNLFKANNQRIRDKLFKLCMEELHSKLTGDKWKYNPAYVYLYCTIVQTWPKLSNVNCEFHHVFPAALILIDDSETDNKLKGLKVCHDILIHLGIPKHKTGYEIIVYETLFKQLRFREMDVLDESIGCLIVMLTLVNQFSPEINTFSVWRRNDDVFEALLNDLYLESDILRKRLYFHHLPYLIEVSETTSLRWKNGIISVIKDAIQMCLSGDILSPILIESLQSFKAFMKLGWKTWKYENDSDFIIMLYKVLISLWEEDDQETESYLTAVEGSLKLCIDLCNQEQKEVILNDDCFDVQFREKWKLVQNKLKQPKT